MSCAQQKPKTKTQNKLSALADTDIGNHWNNIKNKYSQEQLELMPEWLKNKKNEEQSDTEEHNELQDVNPDDLNKYQRFTYDLVIKFKNEKKQLLMILLGTAGTGKSFTVAALTKVYINLIKKASPTAKAAFIINGNLHY